MKPMVALSAMFAAATAAPTAGEYAVAAQPAVAVAAPAIAYNAVAPAISVPAPYTTEQVQGAPITRIEQAPAVVQKQLHFGQTQFVSGYASQIHKPAIPDFNIAVPTVLKGSVAYNPAIEKIVKEPFVVNEPYAVERRVEVPYDVPVVREQLHEVAVPVHVDAPYNVPYAVPVKGETIVNVRQGAPIVQRTHSAHVAAPAIAHVGHVGAIGYNNLNLGYATNLGQVTAVAAEY